MAGEEKWNFRKVKVKEKWSELKGSLRCLRVT